MRNSKAKKIRRLANSVAMSFNDTDNRTSKRLNFDEYNKPFEYFFQFRELTTTSCKYLSKKIKTLYNKVQSPEREMFFDILTRDVENILNTAKNQSLSKQT